MGTTYRSGGSAAYGRGSYAQSRGRTSSGSRGRSGSSRRSSGSRSTGSRGGRGYSSGRSSSTYRSYSSRRRKNSPDYRLIAILGVILILLIALAAYGMTKNPGSGHETKTSAADTSAAESSVPETELQQTVRIDDVEITGLSREDARKKLQQKYPWGMKAVYNGDIYEISDLMAGRVETLLDEIYRGKPKENYHLDTSGLDTEIGAQIAEMRKRWNKAAKNGEITSYDAASDTFVFGADEKGLAIDETKLAEDIRAALSAKDFDAQIQVKADAVEPEIDQSAAKNLYKEISRYVTNTTANSNRNTNVQLAAEAVNGVVLKPGEEFSFNAVVGQRTEERGFKSAAAYNNGEVVQEIGGGICQVSSTLYNAVAVSGLQVTSRRSHTFEPSYVTPGQDATVSWGAPDFCFVNNSKTAIGIRATYKDRVVTVSIYGIPILEEGVTYTLESKKVAEVDPPEPKYEEDQTLQPDEEIVVTDPSYGSKWETKLIVKKDGVVVSEEVDHTSTYKGHAAVIKRNTSGIVIAPSEEETTAPEETQTVPETPGQPASAQPGTQPPETAAPQTAPETQAPVSPPATDAPVTGPPATEPFETQPPVTEAPVTQPSSPSSPGSGVEPPPIAGNEGPSSGGPSSGGPSDNLVVDPPPGN